MSTAVSSRRRPEDRRDEIVRAARTVFFASGYAGAGLAEVAAEGGMSRGLIYRYFPEGRPDLFLAVTEDLLAELHERLRYAAAVPFSAARRMEHLLGALFAFFQDEPAAYRFLFRDVWAAREPEVESAAVAARGLLTSAVVGVLADTGDPADELTAAAVGILGFALATVEQSLAGEVDTEVAWRTACRYATSQLG